MTPERPVLVWGGTGSAKMLRPAITAAAGRVAVLVERNDDVVSPFPDALRLRDEADVARWVAERGGSVDYVLAIGGHNGFERLRLAAFLDGLGLRPLTLVHDHAWVAATAVLGPGCQVMPMAAVGEEAVLGAQCVVNTNASVDHDCRLGDGVHVMPGATLAGCVTVEDGATIGSNATVLPRVRVGAGAQVGAGAVVVRDVSPGMVMVGVPAHVLRGGRIGMSDKTAAEIAFEEEVRRNIDGLGRDAEMAAATGRWMDRSTRHSYSYNFRWMGRPIIQYPQDMVALQEIIWETRPDVIIETGVAHGGSLIFSASMLALLGGGGRVVGVDIDIRPHNRRAIEAHPMAPMITLLQGSSIDDAVVAQVAGLIRPGQRVMVQLDSNHTHDHVLAELRKYAPLVTPGCYLVVFDGIIEDLPADFVKDRPWGIGNNPKTATHAFLAEDDRFEIDRRIQDKLQITVAPDGYLRRVR